MPTPARSPFAVVPVLLVALVLSACGAASPSPSDPVDPTPVAEPACTEPQPGLLGGPAVLLDAAELLGADNLPADVCAYGSESGTSIWIIAEPYDAAFPERIAAWLEPLGWTAEEVGTWGDGHVQNISFMPPADVDIAVAFGHAFSAYPESVSFNLGIDQGFLSHYGVEPGDELAIFAAWR